MRIRLQKDELVKKRKLRASEPDFLDLDAGEGDGPSKRPHANDKYVLDPPGSLFKASGSVEGVEGDEALVPPVLPTPDELLSES
jgi:hypothetical protein